MGQRRNAQRDYRKGSRLKQRVLSLDKGIRAATRNAEGSRVDEKGKKEEWCARGDDFRTFLVEFVSSLSEANLIVGLNA